MEIIKINNLMEDKELKDTRFFLMEFGREVMKSIGEEMVKKYGHINFGDKEIRLQIIVNDKEVKSSDFCHSFIDCISTNMEKKCREIVSGLFEAIFYVERMTNNYLIIGGAKFSKKHSWMCCNHNMFAKLAAEEDIERVEKKKKRIF